MKKEILIPASVVRKVHDKLSDQWEIDIGIELGREMTRADMRQMVLDFGHDIVHEELDVGDIPVNDVVKVLVEEVLAYWDEQFAPRSKKKKQRQR